MSDFVPRPLEDLMLEWPPELDHISASSVKMAVRCPEQWRKRYVHGIKLPPAAALLYGRADHAAIEHSMKQKIHSYVDTPVSEVKGKFVQVLEEEIEKEGGYADLEVRDASNDVVKSVARKKQVVGDVKVSGANLVGQYQQQVSPEWQPSFVEMPIDIKTRLPVKITGYIDLIADPVDVQGDVVMFDDGKRTIIDRKRVNRYGIQAEWRLQADIYQLAHPLPFEWHLSNTSGGGRIQVPDRPNSKMAQSPPDPERALLFLEQIVAEVGFLYRKYGPDHPWPTKGKLHPWACGYCGYRPDCWGWK